jgi:acetyl-CoA carboxylase biotin carboxylase subunit
VRLELPGGPGVRVDTALYAGYTVVPFYDSLICKLMVWAPTRGQAIVRGRRSLEELEIEGIKTTVPIHLDLMNDPNFGTGAVHTGYLEQILERVTPSDGRSPLPVTVGGAAS